ncbi:MAG TPA: BON domain-containing protein, partial [Candidatus Udaeobacter sp.]|nr:BON domain-containing protein [Candidatus Udaeobacter sp.]
MKATNRNLGLLGSVGLGAVLMYIFDPGIGKRRRALMRDKTIRLAHKTADAIDATSHDLQNRILGLVAATRGLTSKKEVGDDVLAQRVRSRLGFLVSHPSSVEVRVENGKVIFSGPILGNEVDRLLRRISSVRGVRTVENRLEVHESAESIPGLQGESRR